MRSLTWHDIFTLYQYRNQVLTLDSVLSQTRGSPLGPAALLAHLNPARDSYTGVVGAANENDSPMIGQIYRFQGNRSAHLSYIMPGDNCRSAAFSALVDGLAREAGLWGVFHLLAEAEETEAVFQALRRCGFSVYGWQRVWQYMEPEVEKGVQGGCWRPATSRDEISIRSLYHSLVPPLVQRAESLPAHPPQGLVYCQDGDIMGYLDGVVGPRGICLQPLIHPSAENVTELLGRLPAYFVPLMGRPVYLVIRSYQAWLEAALEGLQMQVSPLQALLVRYLTNVQRVYPSLVRLATLETPQPETTVPIMYHYICDN